MNSPLKSVPALQVRITCSSTQPTAAQIVALLREKTGVRLALDPKIDPAKPALGSIGGTSAAGTPAAVNSGSATVRSASSATASPFRSTAPPQPSRVGKSRTWIEPDFLRLRRRPRNLCGAGVFGTMLRGLRSFPRCPVSATRFDPAEAPHQARRRPQPPSPSGCRCCRRSVESMTPLHLGGSG